MFSISLFVVTTTTSIFFLTPRLFRIADHFTTRQRLQTRTTPQDLSKQHEIVEMHSPVMFFDSLARATRANVTAREALLAHMHMAPNSAPWVRFTTDIKTDVPIADALKRASHEETGDSALTLLAACLSHGVLIPDALDHAAAVTRENIRMTQSLAVATAQARITMRILTILPIFVVLLTALCSSRFRQSLHTPAVWALLTLGIIINRFGAWWVSRLVASAASFSSRDEVLPLIEHFAVSVRAGYNIPDACAQWQFVHHLGEQISKRLIAGEQLSTSLQPLAASSQLLGAVVTDTLVTAYRDGQPIHETANMLAIEARHAQRQFVETRVRQLSSKLSLPVVLCVLPSFVLLSVVPLIFVPMMQIGHSLPSPLS